MEKQMKKFFKSTIVTSFVLLVLGLLLVFESEKTIFTISYIIGGILVGLGGVAVINYIKKVTETPEKYNLDIAYGVSSIVLGILIITNPKAIASVIPIIIGLGIIISSCTKMQYAINLKTKEDELWKMTMILSVISIICGIVLLFNPFKVAVGITRVVGIFIVIYSIVDIASTIALKTNISKSATKEEKIVDAEVIKEEEKTKVKKGNSKK